MTHRHFCLSLILLIIFTEINAQETDLNKYDQDGKKTGLWESYYESGKIKSHGIFIQGHPVGELLKYYPGGILQAIMNFDETGKISYVKMYYQAGNLASEGKYIEQKKDSVWNYFSAYDKRKALSESYRMGKKYGGSYKFYPDGKPSEYQEWQDDLKHGKWEQYFENGQIRLTGYFVSGLQNGVFLSYNPDGSHSLTGNYLDGLMDGTWTYYTETGELDLSVEYKEGKMLPNPEMDKWNEEFSKKINDAVGKFDELEINEFQ